MSKHKLQWCCWMLESHPSCRIFCSSSDQSGSLQPPNLTQVTVDHLARQLQENEGWDRERQGRRERSGTLTAIIVPVFPCLIFTTCPQEPWPRSPILSSSLTSVTTFYTTHTHTPANHYYSAAATLLRSCWVLSSWHYSAATNRQLTVSVLNFCRGMRTHTAWHMLQHDVCPST